MKQDNRKKYAIRAYLTFVVENLLYISLRKNAQKNVKLILDSMSNMLEKADFLNNSEIR